MCEREIAHRKAVRRFTILPTDQGADLVKAKAKIAATADEAQAMNIGPAIDAPAIGSAADVVQEPNLFIVANGGNSATGSL